MQTLQDVSMSFIQGRYQSSSGGNKHPNYFPGNNKIINYTTYAAQSDLEAAESAALAAFKPWSRMTRQARSAILLRAAAILRERVAELARIEVLDTGKPIAEAMTVDVTSAADALEYFAKTALALEGSVIPDAMAHIYVTHEPLGVCAAIGAWNYPLQIACWKAAPALMMGNTMIYKPSELTPMSALKLAEIFIQAGMPAGVFNVVLGDAEVGEKLLSLSSLAKVSFTGSVPTGKKILRLAADQLLPVTLELGGKSPLIIFDDANVDEAVSGSMLANFYTQGEICSNGTRVYVAQNIYQQFIDKLVARVNQLVIGDPLDNNTQIGALISREHLIRVANYIEQGVAQGAVIATGGEVATTGELSQGNFIKPTIFTHCHDQMTIAREEIFGPVMCVMTFTEEEEVVQRANASSYGLAAGVFTDNIKRAHRVVNAMQAGVCWVNNYNVTPVGMPFGGVKKSGFGRENGRSALLSYSQQKSIYMELQGIDCPYA